MKKYFLTFLITVGFLFAYGGGAGAFLSLGVGTRAFGMGNAFSSLADDATAVYWNPAGFALLKRSEFLISYGLLFEDRTQTFLAYNKPLGIVSLGVGWMNLSIKGISGRDAYGRPTGDLTDSENAFMLGITLRHGLIVENFNIYPGIGIKYLYQTLAGYKATGWGADYGFLVKKEIQKWGIRELRFSFVLQNTGASLKWNTLSEHRDKIPYTQRIGGSVKFSFLPLLFVVENERLPERELSYINLGIEAKVLSLLTLRAGLKRSEFITAGFSLNFNFLKKRFALHYGYSEDPISARGVHKLAISYLGPAPERIPIKFTPPPPETTIVAVHETTEVVKPETLIVGIPQKPKIELEPVYFDFNKWNIKPEYEEVLKRNAEKLLENKNLKVWLIGHTSDEGSQDYNVRLGMKRALAVKEYLVKLGVEPSRIFISSKGFAEPKDLEHPEKNRRVEFEVGY